MTRQGASQVVIAVRGGPASKSRLTDVLAPGQRDRLAAAMLQDMLAAIARRDGGDGVLVVTPDTGLADLARSLGAEAMDQSTPGLNAAFREGLAQAPGEAVVALLPGDLPLLRATDLDAVLAQADDGAVVGVATPDGGTGALVLRARTPFDPQFGRDSFRRHREEARRRGLRFRTAFAPSLSFDLDRPDDIARVLAEGAGTRTAALLRG